MTGTIDPVVAALAAILATTFPDVAQAQAPGTPGNAAGRELTADQQVAHVLNRLAFGPRPGDVQKVRAMGVDQWIETQLHPERIRDDVTIRFISASYRLLEKDAPELFAEIASPAELARRQRRRAATDSARMADAARDTAAIRRARRQAQQIIGELQSAKVARAVLSERQLEQVMVDFWENHFSVFAGKGPTRYFVAEYTREAIRPHALGSFRDLLGAVAESPAMLFYLDNWQSAADSGRPTLRPSQRDRRMPFGARQRRRPGLNENYARELLELHSLGVDGGYTQQDVIEVARAFTGWSIEEPRRKGAFTFRPQVHDAGEKTVLGVRLPAGRGIEDGRQVLDIVAAHPSTAHHIARKLAVRFVSDSPPADLVDRAAKTFLRTNGDIREVVRTIVTSDEFFSRGAYRAKVKSPFELVTSALRAVGAKADSTPRTAQIVARLGQRLYGHEAPDGWPETGEEWINAGSILNRINFGMLLASGRVPGVSLRRLPLAQELRSAPREQQVDAIVAALFNGEVSPDTRAVLVAGENPLSRGEPSMADSTGIARPQRAMSAEAQLLGLALGAPEFQRR